GSLGGWAAQANRGRSKQKRGKQQHDAPLISEPVPARARCLTLAQVTARPGFATFADRQRSDYETSDWVHPPPTKRCIRRKANQDDCRKIGAQLRLRGIRA